MYGRNTMQEATREGRKKEWRKTQHVCKCVMREKGQTDTGTHTCMHMQTYRHINICPLATHTHTHFIFVCLFTLFVTCIHITYVHTCRCIERDTQTHTIYIHNVSIIHTLHIYVHPYISTHTAIRLFFVCSSAAYFSLICDINVSRGVDTAM